MTDGQTAVGMSGWMRVKIVDFETTLAVQYVYGHDWFYAASPYSP